jgi:class 3 adenylate cyclase
MSFRETKLVLVVADLAGYARAISNLEALGVAALLDDWYRRTSRIVRAHGGRVVKWIGDACLATFPDEKSCDAVDAVLELERALAPFASEHRVKLELGASVHVAVVAEGEFGPEDDPRYDVLGSGVNHLFTMGRGSGIHISEPVYRRLPNERRARWTKNRPPATYSLSRSPSS